MRYLPASTPAAILLLLLPFLASCANMGSPDGGPYDETPPKIVGSTPGQNATGVKNGRISLMFDEIIRLDNPSEKIVISPPQLNQPEIRSSGRRITVALKDSIKPNETYTIDFGDAIVDNTEGNPMGNFAFVFSSGESVDTLQVSGKVLEAKNLEPVKGILVGLHSDLSDSAFTSKPFDRVGRTDGSGHFVIKGVAPGKYRIYALLDAEDDYTFRQKSEKIAFTPQIVEPTAAPATRNDTTWLDSTHIDTIRTVAYTRFMPDDIVLRAFDEDMSMRHLLKTERPDPTHFTLYFTGPAAEAPRVKGLNFNADNAFIIDSSAGNDTVTYWIKHKDLLMQDTLELELAYLETNDSTGLMETTTDTLELMSKRTYEKIMKERQKELDDWQKDEDREQKRNKHTTRPRPRTWLRIRYPGVQTIAPTENLHFTFDEPVESIDTARIHLLLTRDTIKEERSYLLRRDGGSLLSYTMFAEWRPGQRYTLQIDTAAVRSIYGHPNSKLDMEFSVPRSEEYASLFVNLKNADGGASHVQLLNQGDQVVREAVADAGQASFFFLKPGTYYLRAYIDINGNGKWDTGLYAEQRQPEPVYYYPGEIKLRANWDIDQDWDVQSRPLDEQKPMKITKQKPDKAKTIQRRNEERERKKNRR